MTAGLTHKPAFGQTDSFGLPNTLCLYEGLSFPTLQMSDVLPRRFLLFDIAFPFSIRHRDFFRAPKIICLRNSY